ncbi:hypothetical protein [Spongiimicrobium salis]|uniref:hypothetical protein n=1 Tax=Spongiimicrobium salis TaxID=1667022 RepID=UPI00374C91CC
MKLYKVVVSAFLIILGYTSGNAQVVTKTQQYKFAVTEDVVLDVWTKYTNLEFAFTDDKVVTIEAILEIEGLSENEVENYFKKWDFKAEQYANEVRIASLLQEESNVELKKRGYYKGYFVDTDKLDAGKVENNNFKKKTLRPSIDQKQNTFDFDTYIEKGNAYLKEWERENNEKVGRRWYHKTKEERIKLKASRRETLPALEKKSTMINQPALKNKNLLPSANVRALSKRAIISKTVKVKFPRNAKLHIKARHGKIVLSEEFKNLKAELSHVLLQANKLSGKQTSIKGSYSNFEIDYWGDGDLNVVFSGYTLIKNVQNMVLTSDASTVSIDDVTKSIDARGNFKMLSIDTSSEIQKVHMDVEDSKKVWLKLPKTAYHFHYEGINSKLIHPEKFTLKTSKSNPRKQIIESNRFLENGPNVHIKSLSSVMQIYDIPWENLKIKSLQE